MFNSRDETVLGLINASFLQAEKKAEYRDIWKTKRKILA